MHKQESYFSSSCHERIGKKKNKRFFPIYLYVFAYLFWD